MFSSAVPSQLVPSCMQAFHDAISHVAERIFWMTSAFKASDSVPAGGPPEEFPEPLSVVLVTGFRSIILLSGFMAASCSVSEISSLIQSWSSTIGDISSGSRAKGL